MTDDDEIQKAYARVLGTSEGKLVLEDLRRESGLDCPVFPPANLDGIALAIRAAQKDGQRLLMGWILNQILDGEFLLKHEGDSEPPEPEPAVIKP